MPPGDEIVASSRLYGGSLQQMRNTYPKFGWKAHIVDADTPDNFKRALTDKTKAFFIESLANPGGVISDIEAIAKIADDAGVPLIVDNTLATPWLCKPIDYGATLVIHSTTKFLSGTGTSMGGAIVDFGQVRLGEGRQVPEPRRARARLSRPQLLRDVRRHGLHLPQPRRRPARSRPQPGAVQRLAHHAGHRDAGPAHGAPLRQRAARSPQYLEKHPAVAWVNYAGLPSNKYHALAKKYLPKGAGSIFTFGVKGGYEVGMKVVDSVDLFSHLANIGDAKSLIIHPASTTHRQLSDEQRVAAGAGPDVIRLSIGIETADDIIADLEQALAKATA